MTKLEGVCIGLMENGEGEHQLPEAIPRGIDPTHT